MQTIHLESGAALAVCSGIQLGEFPQAACSSKDNKTLVASQSARKAYQNRNEDCQAQ